MQRATPDSTFSLEELRLASGRRRRAAANAQLNGGVKAADATHNFFWWESYHSKMKTKAWRWTKDAAESMDERFTVTRHNVDPAAMLRGSNWLLRTHDSLWPLFMAILWVLATVLRRPESIARGYSPIVLETTTMLLHVILLETSHLGWGYSDQASCQLGDGGAAEDSRASIAALTRRSAATAPAISVLCGSLTTATVSTTGAGGLSGGGSRGAPIGRPPLYYSFYSRTAFVVEQSVWFLFAWVLLDPSLSQRVVVAVFFGLGVRWALFGFEGILCALCLTYLARRFSLMPTAVREELLHLPAQEGLIQRFYCAYSFSLAMTLLLSELDLFGDTRSKIVELFLGIPARITRWCHGYGFLQSAASWCFPFSRDQLPFEQVLYGCMGVALWYSFMVLEYTMEISILGLIGLLLTLPLLLGNFGGIRHFWRLCRDGAVRAGIYVAMLVLLKYAELPPSAMGLLANTMRTTAIALYLASRCDRRGEYPAAFALVWLVLVGLDAAMWSGKSFYGDLTTTTNAPLHLWRTSAVPLSSLTVESTTLDDLHALHMLCRWSTLVLHYNTVILGCMYLSTSTMRVLMNDVLVQLFYTTVTVLPSSSVMKAPVKASNASTTPTTNGLATSTRSAISAPRTTTSASGASANPSTSVAGAKASAERRQETAKAPKAAPPAASRQPPPSSSSSPPLSSPASMERMARSQPEVCEEASLTATPVADRSEPLPCGTTCAVVKDLSQELASQLQHASTSNSAPEGILSGSCCSDGDVGRIAHSTDGSSRSSNLSLQAVPSNPTEPHAQTDAVVATLPHTPTECICSGSEGDHKPASSDGADEVVLREPTTINTPPSSLPEPLTAINSATAAPSRKKKAKDAPFHFVEDGKAKQHKAKKKEAAPPPPPVVAAVEREVPPANMAPTVREQRSHVVVKQTSPGAHREIPSVMAVRSALAPSINNAAGGAAKSFSAVVRGEVPTEAAERPAAPLPPPPPPPPLPPPPSSWMSPHRVPLPRSAQQRGTSHSNLGGAYVPYEEQVSMQRPPSPPLRSLPQPTSITPLELLSALMHPSTDSESPARDGTTGAVPYTGGGRQRSTSPSDVQWMLQELLRAPGSSRGGSSPAPHDDVDSVGEGAEQFDFRGVLPSSEEDEPTQQQPPASSLLLDGFSRGGTGHFGAFSQSMTGESGYLANVRRSSGGQEMGPSIFTSMRTEYGRPSVGADPAAWWPLQPGDDASTMPPPTDSPETSRSSLALPVMPNNVVSPQQTALSPPPYPRTPPSATSHPVEGGSYAFSTATGPMMPNMPNVMAPPVFTTSPGMLMSSVPSSYQIIPAQVAQTPMVLVPMTAVYPMMYGNTASPPTQLPVAPYWQQTTETQGGWAASNGEGLEPRSRPSS